MAGGPERPSPASSAICDLRSKLRHRADGRELDAKSAPPRGIGRLWESTSDIAAAPLAGVLGRTRAAILALLELPMSTTQLAAQLDLAAPTLNVHLRSLRSAGIVSSRRDGRAVLYQRTPLGDHLMAGPGRTSGGACA